MMPQKDGRHWLRWLGDMLIADLLSEP